MRLCPCCCHRPSRSRSVTLPVWCFSSIEKAYAKLHSSYAALDGGMVHDALVDLTGGIGERIPLEETEDEACWSMLFRESKNNLLGAGTRGVRWGCVCSLLLWALSCDTCRAQMKSRHAFAVVELVELKEGTRVKHRLVKLRNPHGINLWDHHWSKHDDLNWAKAQDLINCEPSARCPHAELIPAMLRPD